MNTPILLNSPNVTYSQVKTIVMNNNSSTLFSKALFALKTFLFAVILLGSYECIQAQGTCSTGRTGNGGAYNINSAFGARYWNCYALRGRNIGSPQNLEYRGFFTLSTLGINQNYGNCSPNQAVGYTPCSGCNNAVGDANNNADRFTVVYKRQGFPCGKYTIRYAAHDDNGNIFLNGNQIYSSFTCCGPGGVLGPYDLDGNSTIEVRFGEEGGGANANVEIIPHGISGGTITGPVNACVGNQITLSNFISGTVSAGYAVAYKWYRYNPNTAAWEFIIDNGPASLTENAPLQTGAYTYLRRAYIKCGNYESECFEYACYDATFVVNVTNIVPTAGTVTLNGTTSGVVEVCAGTTLTVSQSGWNNQGGVTYFYAAATNAVGGWEIDGWSIMNYGNITPANQVSNNTNVNNLGSFNFKINTPGLYILHTNAERGGCYTPTGGVNRYIRVVSNNPGAVTAPASICAGTPTNITNVTAASSNSANPVSYTYYWQRTSAPIQGWTPYETTTNLTSALPSAVINTPGTYILARNSDFGCGQVSAPFLNFTVFGVPTTGTFTVEGSTNANVTACWGQTIDLSHTGWNNQGGTMAYYVGTKVGNWVTSWNVLNGSACANTNSCSYNSGLFPPGDYIAHIYMDNGGCTASLTRELRIVGANGGTISLSNNSICNGGSVTVNSDVNATLFGASDLTFDWFRRDVGNATWTTLFTNVPNQSITDVPPGPGTYFYLRRAYSAACGAGTNSQFREDAATVNLTVSAATNPGTISGVPAQICEGSNVVYTANIVSGTFQQFEYQWNATDPNGWTTTWGGTNPYTWVAGWPNNTLNVRARVQSGACSVEYTPVVSTFVNPLPVLAANTGGITFNSGSISLLENSTSGGTWSSSNTNIAVINNPSAGLLTGVNPGSATITYTVTNGFGCTSTASTNVTVVPVVIPFTGADASYTVPAGVTKIRVKMWGAGGGGGQSGGPGGGGAFVEGDLCVTPGEVLTLIVGGGGLGGNGLQPNTNAYGGGGASPDKGADAGGGGGRTAIRRNSTGVEIAIAGAGGGGAGGSNKRGGAAGGVGANAESGQGGEGGAGGTAGGAGGNNYSRNPSISGGSWNGAVGGNGGNGEQCCSNRAGGGGGSGFGGGSGGLSGDNNSGAGGGGSSYFSGTLVTSASGSAQAAGQWANADNGNAFGGGGNANSNGQNGRIVISVAELTTAGVLSVSAPGYTGGSTIDVCPGTQITVIRGGGSGTANYWAGDETNALEEWHYFGNQQYGNSFNYTFNNPGFYLIRTHPSNTCGYNYNEVSDVRVFVRPVDAKSISANQTICPGTAPATLTGGTPDNGAGAYTFNWQQSTDNGVTWVNAPGTRTNASYSPPALTVETLFKRQVSSRNCATTEGELVNWAWTSGNVWASNSSIKKFNTLPDDWNAGAISSQSITNNGGYVEATTFKLLGAQMIGLGNYDTDPSYTSIEFAIHAINGTVQVYESGVYRGDFTTYVRGDVMRVAVENNQIKYYKNGVLFYTSLVTPTFPLYADAAVYAGGSGAPSYIANGPYSVSSGFKFVRIFNPVKVNLNASPTFGNPAITRTPLGPQFSGTAHSLTGNASGGTGTLTYSWSSANLIPSTFSGNPFNNATANYNGPDNSVQANYSVTVTDANSCTATAALAPFIFKLPNVNGSASICAGTQTNYTATFPASGPNMPTLGTHYSNFEWELVTTVAGTLNATGTPAQASVSWNVGYSGAATIRVRAIGIAPTVTSAWVNYNVTVNTLPNNVTANSNTPVDLGQVINLTSTPNGATTYAWSGPAGYSVSNTQNPSRSNALLSHAGVYTVTVTDANGCTGTATTTVVVNTTGLVWNGNVDADWFEENNWTPAIVPDATLDATIPAGRPNYPIITTFLQPAEVRNLSVKRQRIGNYRCRLRFRDTWQPY
jgi:hypothetical protein